MICFLCSVASPAVTPYAAASQLGDVVGVSRGETAPFHEQSLDPEKHHRDPYAMRSTLRMTGMRICIMSGRFYFAKVVYFMLKMVRMWSEFCNLVVQL